MWKTIAELIRAGREASKSTAQTARLCLLLLMLAAAAAMVLYLALNLPIVIGG
jgi:hypothetical protein